MRIGWLFFPAGIVRNRRKPSRSWNHNLVYILPQSNGNCGILETRNHDNNMVRCISVRCLVSVGSRNSCRWVPVRQVRFVRILRYVYQTSLQCGSCWLQYPLLCQCMIISFRGNVPPHTKSSMEPSFHKSVI